MEKTQIQFAYWSHGKMDTGFQDELMEEEFPEFFQPGHLNLLGTEDSGSFTDEQREYQLKRAMHSPEVNCFSHPAERDAEFKGNPFLCKRTTCFSALINHGYSAFMNRQRIILNKWNIENPDTIVLPFVESVKDEEALVEAEKASEGLDLY